MMRDLRKRVKPVLVFILGLCMALAAQAQSVTVKGTVTSKSDGLPLPGVNVVVKGTVNGTTTDADGKFSIEAASGSTLAFSYIGYATAEVAVSTQTEITVVMEEDAKALSEVVVTALGISKESAKVGYAVSTVSSDQFNRARETNFANSLQGTVAGLNVKGTSSGPGGTSKILLRGLPSMNSGGAPLFVINGVPMDNTQRGSSGEWGGGDSGDGIGNLNPDDIENVTVLKGQAASALYGARASNGVILITTKKGKKNDFAVEYNMNYMSDHAMNLTDFQYDYGQGVNGAKPTNSADAQASSRMAWGAKLDGSQVVQFDGKTYAYSAQKDNISNFYRTGSSFTNTVSVSKGGENGAVRLSLSNLNNNSIVPNSGLDRRTINLSFDQKITKKLTVNAMGNYIDEQKKNVPYLSDGPMNPNNGLFLAGNIDERILAPGYDPNTGRETRWGDDEYVTNPYFVTSQFVNNISRSRLISSVMTRYDVTSWLYVQGRVGYDIINDRKFTVTPWGTAYSSKFAGGLDEQSKLQRTELNLEGIIGVNKKITEDISLDALVGGNIRKNEYEKVQVSGSPFILPYIYSLSNTLNRYTSYEYTKKGVNSGFYSIDLSYKGYLNLTATGRYDDYSTLYSISNPSKKTGLFTPSVAASFLFSEVLNSDKLNYGKFRMSYAQTSGEITDPYQTSLYYSLDNSFNGKPMGTFNTTSPNSFLNPFTVTEVEIGTELKFFQNRLGFDIAWYNRKTHNEIMNANYTSASGFTNGYVGTGSTQNTGIELQIKGTPIQRGDFNWNVTFNFTSVANEILSTDATNGIINLGSNRGTLGNARTAYVVGYAGPQITAYDYKRSASGEIVVDKDGLPERGELIKLGSVLPKNYGGLTNQFSYKGINFSFLIDYNFGNKVLSATEYYSIKRGLNKITLNGRDGITTGVTESGATNTVKASAQDYYNALANNVTATSVVSGDFIKLRQLSIGYQIPASILGKSPFSSVQVSFVARNLAILYREAKNIDPEASFGSNVTYYGIEGTSLPSARSYGFNVNFKFK